MMGEDMKVEGNTGDRRKVEIGEVGRLGQGDVLELPGIPMTMAANMVGKAEVFLGRAVGEKEVGQAVGVNVESEDNPPLLSRCHAKLTLTRRIKTDEDFENPVEVGGFNFLIEDLDSKNGTYLWDDNEGEWSSATMSNVSVTRGSEALIRLGPKVMVKLSFDEDRNVFEIRRDVWNDGDEAKTVFERGERFKPPRPRG